MFDPEISCDGTPAFVPLNNLSGLSPQQLAALESELGVDYCVVQSTARMTMAWRDAIRAAGASILEVRDDDALSVSVPESMGCLSLSLVPGTRGVCSWKPAHVPTWPLLPVLSGSIPAGFLQEDGSLIMNAVVHHGEDPRSYEPLVALELGCVEVLDSTVPSDAGDPRFLTVRVTASPAMDSCAALAAAWLCRMEAVEAVIVGPNAPDALDESVWYTQTSIAPVPPSPKYDGTAKLFENGVTGRGQVIAIADTGLDTDDCHFRYGPNLADVTPVLAHDGCYIPPLAATSTGNGSGCVLQDPNWNPENKVIAYYFDRNDPSDIPYVASEHGTAIAGAAAGDTYSFLAASFGIELDDPFDDERSPGSPDPDPYGTLVNHHQVADGAAPGAQLIIQEVDPNGPRGEPPGDLVRQAYLTESVLSSPLAYHAGARAWNCSTGSCLGGEKAATDYGYLAQSLDRVAYQLRDALPTAAAGNEGPGYPHAIPWNGGYKFMEAAGAKNALGVGATKHATANGGLAVDLMNVGPGDFVTSSHGPGFKGRVKPDLVVPGQDLELPTWSTVVEDGSGNGDSSCERIIGSGTSAAAPQVAGLAMAVRQYFMDGYYPGGAPSLNRGFVPTSALLRATLTNSTRNLAGGAGTGDAGYLPGDRPTFGQGWGKVVIDDTLYFAGDPTNAPAERARMIVLNDVPNGLVSTADINDSRGAIVDSFKPAISELEVHEFSIDVKQQGDLHVTLAWTDVEGNVSSAINPFDPQFGGEAPLRNDLDLEVVDPNGVVWRPQPGAKPVYDAGGNFIGVSSTGDTDRRLWSAGYSIPGAAPCAAGCGATCPTTPFVELERQNEQDVAALCDFKGRDGMNTVENVFIRALDVETGAYRIRVIGYEVQGNGKTCQQPDGSDCVVSRPNFVDTDLVESHDLTSDLRQGYALVVSGPATPATGHLVFDRASYECGDNPLTPEIEGVATITLSRRDDPALVDPRVVVSTQAGDCDEFPLFPEPGDPNSFRSAPIPIVPLTDPAPRLGCNVDHSSWPPPLQDGYLGDGAVQVLDDGWISASIVVPTLPTGTRILEAGAKAQCRDVTATNVVVSDPCAGPSSNGELNPNELATVTVDVSSVGLTGLVGLVGELVPADDRVSVIPSRAVLMQDNLDPGVLTPPAAPRGSFSVFVDATLAGPECYSPLQFRLELTGEDGFQDAVNIDVPLSCLTVGTGMPTRPAEVPSTSLRVVKFPLDASLGQSDLLVTWDAAAGASAHNLWRGQVELLRRGAYDHVIPDDANPATRNEAYCEPPTGVYSLLALGALPREYDHALYFLATGEAPCALALGSMDGPFGHADTLNDLPPSPDPAEIPSGRRLDGQCP